MNLTELDALAQQLANQSAKASSHSTRHGEAVDVETEHASMKGPIGSKCQPHSLAKRYFPAKVTRYISSLEDLLSLDNGKSERETQRRWEFFQELRAGIQRKKSVILSSIFYHLRRQAVFDIEVR